MRDTCCELHVAGCGVRGTSEIRIGLLTKNQIFWGFRQ